jgi:hypothetical protein
VIDVNKFIDAVQAEISDVSTYLANGTAKDFAEYKAKAGYVQGMHKVMEILNGLMDEQNDA